ncbi:MAG: hypothetical protein LBR72_05500 [Oscillospiraceae bacterium]|jgi:hypothetical protein|nr:hypothetical protein [Oscillospiraceae bacterium]
MSKMSLLVVKDGAVFDMSQLVSDATWSGRKGSAARTLAVNFIDDDGYWHERTGIDAESGHRCVFSWDGQELFRGLIMRQEQSKRKTMSVKAYDNGIYLVNNKDTFVYSGATASSIFTDVCKRFGIAYGSVADTGYVIPELPKPKASGWDVVTDALSLTYKATGARYYPLCSGEAVSLIRRRENILQWVIEDGVNLSDYSLSRSIEKIRTRVKILSKEGVVLSEASDQALERKIGIFQDVEQLKDTMNEAQLGEYAKSALAENNKPDRSLSIQALGQPDIITGIGVFVIIKHLGISKTYYVDDDTHTFKGNHHSMKLKLVLAGDTDAPAPEDGKTDEIKVGDTVNFAGGSHYVSSTAATPTGGNRTAGSAKCTIIKKGAPHPYHLIGISSNVYGWVDAGLVSKA